MTTNNRAGVGMDGTPIDWRSLDVAMDALKEAVGSHNKDDQKFAWSYIMKKIPDSGMMEFFDDNPEMKYVGNFYEVSE